MFDLIHNAIPVFVLLLILEAISYRLAHHDHDHDDHQPETVGYEVRDTRTRLLMGPHAWWSWILLFFLDDLAYYAYHRAGHRIRLLWASHVVHHSSQHYNLSTARRQTW